MTSSTCTPPRYRQPNLKSSTPATFAHLSFYSYAPTMAVPVLGACRQEPQKAFHKRIAFCLDVHNEAVKSMRYVLGVAAYSHTPPLLTSCLAVCPALSGRRYPPDAYKKELRAGVKVRGPGQRH